jgi:hypothetical protein
MVIWETCSDQLQLTNSLIGLAEVKMAQGDVVEAHKLGRQGDKLLAGYPDDVWAQKMQKQLLEVTAASEATVTP